MPQSSTHYLALDGGGTGCRARVTDAAGRVLGAGAAGPASLRLGADAAWAALMVAADDALRQAGLDAALHTIHCGIGVAGIGRIGATAALEAKPHPFASRRIASDALTACLGAHAGRDGGIVIAGTGSVAFAVVAGREIRAGGWGFPVSDEGSGAWLGLEALRLALRAHDGRGAKSALSARLLARFGDDPFAVVDWMERASATDYAMLAPEVATAAAAGDAAAIELLRRAAAEIAGLIAALVAQGAPRVALLGGLAPVLEPWLPSAARGRLVAPRGDGIDGALRLAGFAGADARP